MDREIAQKWITKLRTGNIVQLRGLLGDCKGARCAWGVLCDIAVEEGIIQVVQYRDLYNDGICYYGDGSSIFRSTYPPKSVVAWAKLKNSHPHYEQDRLSFMNDNRSYSFQEIANFIEEHMDEL